MTEALALPGPRRGRRRARPTGLLVLLALLGLALIGGSVAAIMMLAGYDLHFQRNAASSAAPVTASAADLRGLLDTQLMPISAGEAERRNAERPTDVALVSAAKPFAVADSFRDAAPFRTALQCLTQAVYYEAASESDAGQRSVAQVVLNRVRHPAFPNSVCGVVYQGSELSTGCQFSFTCDGSLSRVPSTGGWARARRIALAALSGWVEPSVGLSTHYHASYVLPYWASSLDKVLTVGAHIFYSMRGGLGSSRAFTSRYNLAGEVVPAAKLASAASPLDALPGGGPATAAQPLSAQVAAPPIPVLAEDRRAAGSRPLAEAQRMTEASAPALRADENRGALAPSAANSRLLVD